MEVQLTPEVEQFVQSSVETGKYATATDVLMEGLLALQERDHQAALNEVRRKIQEGLDDLARGNTVDMAECFDELIRELHEEQLSNGKAECAVSD